MDDLKERLQSKERCFWVGGEQPASPDSIFGEALARIEALEAKVKAAGEALAEIADLHGEINPSNYDHDDACELNRQFCYALTIAAAALANLRRAER